MLQLAVFDVDGTIAQKGAIPDSVISGLAHLRKQGCITTVSTGRGYARLKELLAERFGDVISDDALLVVEHGTRIVDSAGNDVYIADLKDDEKVHITDFLRANFDIVRGAWFNPAASRPQFWVADESMLEVEIDSRSGYADVFTGSITELRSRMESVVISSVGVKLQPFVNVENLKLHLTRSNLDLVFQDGNMEFIKNNANKAIALRYLMNHHDCASDSLLVAGNAINDAEMLDGYAAERILVGGEESDAVLGYLSEPHSVKRVIDPQALGEYIGSL